MAKLKAADVTAPRLEIRFGALMPKLATQIKAQGFRFNVEKVKRMQRSHDAIALLAVNGYLTSDMKTRLHTKLWKNILAHFETENRAMRTAHLFHTNLKALRDYRGQSQQDIADALHIRRARYASWEQGICEPSLDNLLALGSHYNVRLEVLLLQDLATLNGFDLQRVVKSNPVTA